MEKINEILAKANECLNCKKPMCKTGCPISTNIPEFIQNIKNNNFLEAYKILQDNNIMSKICGIVCPTENQCRGNCIRGIKGAPVDINELEKFVNIWAEENNIQNQIYIRETNNTKIAIIGSGPSGISCAVELKKKGYEVTIFEKEEKAGGLLEYGIPNFRLSKADVAQVIEALKKIGIEIKNNIEFGKDINVEDLKNQGYKAIFLGIGADISNTYKLTEENYIGIYNADEILRKYYYNKKIENLGKVVVIGGGNVAIDSARALQRMGAETVTVVYRRTRNLMPAIKKEVEKALKEGIQFIYNTKVISVNGMKQNKNRIECVQCIKTEIVNNKVVEIKNSEFKIPTNTVIFAIGLGIDEELFKNLGIKTENGLVKIDENNMTNIPGVFAGGDLTEKKSTVCKAIQTGKKAANGIDFYLGQYSNM